MIRFRWVALAVTTVMLGLILAILLVEGIYRAWITFIPPLSYPHRFNSQAMPYQGFNPGSSGNIRGGRVNIDDFGLRNGARPFVWDAKSRIMLIGDSVCFGVGLDDQETLAVVLDESMLESGVSVVNFCHPGLDTPDLRNRLVELGSRTLPWRQVVWMYYVNDAKYSKQYQPYRAPSEQYGSDPLLLWPKALMLYLDRLASLNRLRNTADDWSSYYQWSLAAFDPESGNLDHERRYLDDAVAWCAQNGVPLAIVYSPAKDQLFDGNRAPQRFLEDYARQVRVGFIDLTPFIGELLARFDPYLDGDQAHFNAAGTRAVAGYLADRIRLPANVPGSE